MTRLALPACLRPQRCPLIPRASSRGYTEQGSVTRASRPPPSRASSSRRPPCRVATRLAIASPSPAPDEPLRASSRRVKGCFRRSTSSGGMPGPAIEHGQGDEPGDRGSAQDRLRRPHGAPRWRAGCRPGAASRAGAASAAAPRRARSAPPRPCARRARRTRARAPRDSRAASGSAASLRVKSMNWSMIAFMSSRSSTMPRCVSASTLAPSISTSRRRRESGVRRSWEMPARNVARSRSLLRRSSFIWLNARATARISDGPVSGTAGGSPPWPSLRRGARELAPAVG